MDPVVFPPELQSTHDPGGRRIARFIGLWLVGERSARFVNTNSGNVWDKADERLRTWAQRSPRGTGQYDVVLAEIRWPGHTYCTEYLLRRGDVRLEGPLLARHIRREAEFYSGRRRGEWDPDAYAAHLRTFDRRVLAAAGRLLDEYAIGAHGAGEEQLRFL